MRPRPFVLRMLALLALALPAAAQSPAAKFDQDFSQGLGSFAVSSWRTSPAGGISAAVTHNGKKAVELVGSASPDVVTGLTWKEPAVRLLAGQEYTLSVFVKTESATALEMRLELPQGVSASGWKEEKLTGTSDWRELRQSFTLSRDAQPRMIAVQLSGPGKAWVSEFRLLGKVGQEWERKITIDPDDVKGALAREKLGGQAVNWFTGRWPYISFLGGMAMGNRSEDMEFFYSEPFKWHTTSLDFVMEGGGKVSGLRVRFDRYKEKWGGGQPGAMRSFLLDIRPYVLLPEYYPSAIYANGRRIWDYRKHKMGAASILVPFSLEAGVDPVIDIVVDKEYTPGTKGLALRMLFLNYLGDPGVKVDLAGAEEKASGSPADALKKFPFGLYPSGYDFWTEKGVPIAQIKRDWKPNFRPSYPTDDVFTCPYCFEGTAGSDYHDFMVSYGGCNVAGVGAKPELFKANPALRGALATAAGKDPAGDAKRILEIDPKLQAFWFRGEQGNSVSDKATIEAWKKTAGGPERCVSLYEPFPPGLGVHREYERGTDLLILKNEEDPQANLMISMGRGMGRSFGRPFGFYWEQTHYPFPSVDEKLHACLLYYLSGGSWISAELDEAPSFAKGVVADWVYPYVQALRFAMVHPARGNPIVPVGIVCNTQDNWTVPYNPFGHMDTFRRYVEYDSATNKLTCEPSFTKVFPWMGEDIKNWRTAGHVALYLDKLDELRGYDLLDVFFPQYGDAFTAHITRILTGTPYGPVDFVPLEKAPAEHLKTYGVLACLGKNWVRGDTEAKLAEAAQNGSQVLVAAEDFPIYNGSIGGKPFGLQFQPGSSKVEGEVSGLDEVCAGKKGRFSGELFAAKGEGWETVASVSDAAAPKPLLLRRPFGRGMVYVYLGRWVWQGADALRPVLAYAGEQAAPLRFARPDDQMEYVAYKKGAGAWVALLNHGNIVVGCDRLDPSKWRVQPPEPLFTKPKGPYAGAVEFRLEKLGLDSKGGYALYQVLGIDGKEFEQVIAGKQSFQVREIPFQAKGGVLTATVRVDKRAEYVVAPRGKGEVVFFGKP